ncbi:MAG TPA: CPBP family intramembrane glutamic endopeptidase [Kofleriaceae bacterium]
MTALAIAYLVILTAVDITWSPKYLASIRARVAANDPTSRRSMYRMFIAFDWIGAALALAILVGGGLSSRAIGLTPPSGEWLEAHAGLLGGAAMGVIAGGVVMLLRPTKTKLVGDIDVLVPRTTEERGWFALLAITAGITEEVMYRALPIIVLTALLPSPWWAVGISAVVFGVAHFYQGVAGVIATAIMGAVFGALYVLGHSLLPVMILHAMIDLRLLAIRRS